MIFVSLENVSEKRNVRKKVQRAACPLLRNYNSRKDFGKVNCFGRRYGFFDLQCLVMRLSKKGVISYSIRDLLSLIIAGDAVSVSGMTV